MIDKHPFPFSCLQPHLESEFMTDSVSFAAKISFPKIFYSASKEIVLGKEYRNRGKIILHP